ncbi:MAG: hypothetical protein ACK4S2_06660, partial [Gemmobacter sp.]|uniref:hypothetical protein n=1 Tax=Gemmobacter sp. TaxID=1898957 RepID=UPI00391D7B90
MCQSCFQLSCVGVEGCASAPGLARGPGLAPAAATEVRDYTALLAYLDYPGTRFNALLPQPGAPVFVSYRFLESDQLPPLDAVAYAVTEVWSFGTAQRDSTRAALAQLAATAGVVFVETTADTAMVDFHGASGSTWAGWSNYPSVGDWGVGRGTLVMNRADSFAPGSASFQVLLHELGHAVGLKHPFDGGLVLAPDLDRTENTLMSYSWSSSNLRVYSPFDVQALQHLYGAPRDLTGWTWAYQGWTFVLAAGPGDDIIPGTGSANSLAGGAGADLILGGPLNDTLTGGAGNDTLRGLQGNNLLIGGDGDDLFEGAAWGGRDTIWGGAGHDRVTLRAGNNEVWAGPGNDTLSGGSGSDTLGGGAGDDLIEALDGQRNRLWGGDGQDTLRTAAWGDGAGGGFGNDLVHGGNGWDTLMG